MNQNIIKQSINTYFDVSLEYYVRTGTNDKDVITSIIHTDEYRLKDINLQPDDIVIDIGSHIGGLSIFAAKIYGARVYSYEPLPENVVIQHQSIHLHNLSHLINLFPLAVSLSTYSEYEIYYGLLDDHHKYIGNASPRSNVFRIVQTTSLSDIFYNNNIECCKLLKMDCEGEEWNIISSVDESILNKIDYISVEVHEDADRFIDLICKYFTEIQFKGQRLSSTISTRLYQNKTGD